MVDFKYKVTDIAKDFGISTKKVIETFAELTGETRKTGATFEENEVNALLEALTAQTARVQKRRAEEKAHQKNIRQGKKRASGSKH